MDVNLAERKDVVEAEINAFKFTGGWKGYDDR